MHLAIFLLAEEFGNHGEAAFRYVMPNGDIYAFSGKQQGQMKFCAPTSYLALRNWCIVPIERSEPGE